MSIHTLHGIQPTALLLPHEIHLAHISLANQLDLVEAGRAYFDVPHFNGIRAVRPPERYRIEQVRRLQGSEPILCGHGEGTGVRRLVVRKSHHARASILCERLFA